MGLQLRQVSEFGFSLAPYEVPDPARRAAAFMCLDTLGVAAASAQLGSWPYRPRCGQATLCFR